MARIQKALFEAIIRQDMHFMDTVSSPPSLPLPIHQIAVSCGCNKATVIAASGRFLGGNKTIGIARIRFAVNSAEA